MMPEHAVPEGLQCPGCGYDVSGLLRGGPCPECGVRLGEPELAHAEARRRLVVEGPRMLRRRIAFWGLVVPAMAGGAALMDGGRDAIITLVTSLAILSTLVGASVLLGALAAAVGPAPEREVRWLLWVRSLHWIHGPWLVIPGCTVLAVLVAGLASILSRGSEAMENSAFVLAIVGLPLWFAGCVWCVARWSLSWSAQFGLRPWPTVLGGVFMLAFWGASVVCGLVGGVLATAGVIHIFETGAGFRVP